MSRHRSRGVRALAVVAAMGLLGGCGVPALSDLPLPGGAPSGSAYHVTAEFADVLDLVPQSAVKVNDVTVGHVEKVSLSGWTARVRLSISRNVHLPDNATAAIRQTSLLGEKFVALAAPVGQPAEGSLGDGDVIPLARTQRAAEVEEVLAALGMLLNGGGLAQLKTINHELGAALAGRETAARDVFRQLDSFVAGLDAQKADIVRAIDALDRLSARLAQQKKTIGNAVDVLAPGLTVLAQQRQQLTATLTALARLGQVGTRVVNQSRADTVADLNALRPTLDQLAKAGDDLPKSLDFLLTYPFPPNVTGAISGDFVNLSARAALDATTILANLLAAPPPKTSSGKGLTVPGLPGLPGTPGVPAPTLPPVPKPTVPGLPSPSATPLPVPTLPGGLPSPTLRLGGMVGGDWNALVTLLLGGLAP